mgnify:CR=1 FL=1
MFLEEDFKLKFVDYVSFVVLNQNVLTDNFPGFWATHIFLHFKDDHLVGVLCRGVFLRHIIDWWSVDILVNVNTDRDGRGNFSTFRQLCRGQQTPFWREQVFTFWDLSFSPISSWPLYRYLVESSAVNFFFRFNCVSSCNNRNGGFWSMYLAPKKHFHECRTCFLEELFFFKLKNSYFWGKCSILLNPPPVLSSKKEDLFFQTLGKY